MQKWYYDKTTDNALRKAVNFAAETLSPENYIAARYLERFRKHLLYSNRSIHCVQVVLDFSQGGFKLINAFQLVPVPTCMASDSYLFVWEKPFGKKNYNYNFVPGTLNASWISWEERGRWRGKVRTPCVKENICYIEYISIIYASIPANWFNGDRIPSTNRRLALNRQNTMCGGGGGGLGGKGRSLI
jgi:hypothetical protein